MIQCIYWKLNLLFFISFQEIKYKSFLWKLYFSTSFSACLKILSRERNVKSHFINQMLLSLTNTLSRKVLSLPFWLFFSFIRYSFPCLEWAAWFRLALQCSTACISSTTQDWSWSAWPQRNTLLPRQSSTWTWSHSSCACWNSVENAKDATIRLKTGFLLDQIITPMKFILNDLEKHILLYRHNPLWL